MANHDKRMQEIRQHLEDSHPSSKSAAVPWTAHLREDVAYLLALLDAPTAIVTFKDDMTPEHREEVKRLAAEMTDRVNLLIPTPATPRMDFVLIPDDGSVRLEHFGPSRLADAYDVFVKGQQILGHVMENVRPEPPPSGSAAPATPQCSIVHYVSQYDRWSSCRLDTTCVACAVAIEQARALAMTHGDPDEDDDDDGTDTPDLETDAAAQQPFKPKCTCPIDILATMGCQCGGN